MIFFFLKTKNDKKYRGTSEKHLETENIFNSYIRADNSPSGMFSERALRVKVKKMIN